MYMYVCMCLYALHHKTIFRLNLRTKQATDTTPKSTKSNDTVLPEATSDFVEEQKRRLEQFNKVRTVQLT